MVLIDIIIKSSNQRYEDQTIECDLEWTVKTLKTHISSVYPSKPRIEDQRLIYSGHLLKNDQSLREVLQPIDDNLSFTVHLVCAQSSAQPCVHSSPESSKATTSSATTMADNSRNTDSNTTDNTSTAQRNDANNTNQNPFGFPLNGQFSPNPFTMGVNNASVLPPEQMWQQMAHFQQAYVQYMAQYFNQNPYVVQNIVNTNPTIPTTVPPLPEQPPPQPIIDGQQEAVIPPPNGAQIPQPQVRMNAGPGGQAVIDDDEEARNRDWLDLFYWMSRAVVLLSIIYFYSSFTRFVLVVFLSILLYIYQKNWFNNNNRNNNHLNNDNNNRLAQNVVNNNNNELAVNREQVRNDGPNDGTEVVDRHRTQVNNTSDSNEGRITDRFTGLRFCWVVVSSLFTSLIPDTPGANVNLN